MWGWGYKSGRQINQRPCLTSAVSVSTAADREGQVGGESAGSGLEHQALSSRDSKESFACCLFSFLFLCHGFFLKKIFFELGGGEAQFQERISLCSPG